MLMIKMGMILTTLVIRNMTYLMISNNIKRSLLPTF